MGLDNNINVNNNQLNHTMFNIPVNNNILNDNNSMIIDSNNQKNILNNTLMINNKRINNYQMMPKIEDPNDDNQKKTLEEFKELLKKMDEKLDITKQE